MARIISSSAGAGAGVGERRGAGRLAAGQRGATGTTGRSSGREQRKKRYTVVGNPYWMAPEMMKGNKYDEKVDIFSFGIVLVHADPDYLPRSSDFGLSQQIFLEKFCTSCPEPLYRVAFLCCDLNPDKRPPFEVVEVWLEGLAMHLAVGMSLPYDLEYDILHYSGRSTSSSESNTPEILSPSTNPPPLQPIKESSPAKCSSKKIEEVPSPVTRLSDASPTSPTSPPTLSRRRNCVTINPSTFPSKNNCSIPAPSLHRRRNCITVLTVSNPSTPPPTKPSPTSPASTPCSLKSLKRPDSPVESTAL
ncbi:hypothetical protein B566_EDAN005554 [Ephemera danica]|nr:hypothetical protein B566_EDAN005554 [Ephemera danica]